MPFRTGLRLPGISAFSVSIITLTACLLSAAAPSVARADGKRFVAHASTDAFDAAAALAQFASPTIATTPLDAAGLVKEYNPSPFQMPLASNRTARTSALFDWSSAANSSDEDPLANDGPAFDANSNQGAGGDSTVSQSLAGFYGFGGPGFFFYGGVPATTGLAGQSLANAGSNPIDLGTGHSGAINLNSSDGLGGIHNRVAPRITWPARIWSGQPVSVPEPSSLLMLGCGVLALGLLRGYRPAKPL